MEGRRETEYSVCANQLEQIDWNQIIWNSIKHQVERIQQKIFRDARKGNFRKVKQYQKLLVRSLPARLWAVRLTTEINNGRNTPGIDGRIYKTGIEKMHLVASLRLRNYKADPLKIRFIPKLNWNVDIKDLIKGLNRRIRGFCNYYRWSDAHRAFGYLSYRIWELMWRWAKRRHPKQNSGWLRKHYWKEIGNSKWVFTYQGVNLVQPYTLTVQWWKWPKVKIHSSPYDPEAIKYWQYQQRRRKVR